MLHLTAQTFDVDLHKRPGPINTTAVVDIPDLDTPERLLWAAVLLRAIADAKGKDSAQRVCTDCEGNNMKHGHSVQTCARRWLQSEDCRAVCETLGLEPSWMLKRVK